MLGRDFNFIIWFSEGLLFTLISDYYFFLMFLCSQELPQLFVLSYSFFRCVVIYSLRSFRLIIMTFILFLHGVKNENLNLLATIMYLLYLLVISAVYKVFLLFFSTPCLSFEVYCTNFWSNAVFLHNHLRNICYSLKNFCYKNHYMSLYVVILWL